MKKNRSVWLPVAVVLAAGFYYFATTYPFKSAKTLEPVKLEALVKTDIKLGTGVTAEAGKHVSVHYTGWLYDEQASGHRGAKFDSSLDRNQPFSFKLGAGEVIPGWDHGVQGMQVGGKRLLIIPPELAYGARGAGGVIPPNAKLVFEVELLGVR
jgi:FKBP-type peptidyl-prolyl cis-trans isomerase FkpA